MSRRSSAPLEPDQLDELLSADLDGELRRGRPRPRPDRRRRARPAARHPRCRRATGALASPRAICSAGASDRRAARGPPAREGRPRRGRGDSAHAAERKRRRNRILLGAGGIVAAASSCARRRCHEHQLVPRRHAPPQSASSPAAVAADTRGRSRTAPAVTALGSFTELHAARGRGGQRDAATRVDDRDREQELDRPPTGTRRDRRAVRGRRRDQRGRNSERRSELRRLPETCGRRRIQLAHHHDRPPGHGRTAQPRGHAGPHVQRSTAGSGRRHPRTPRDRDPVGQAGRRPRVRRAPASTSS